MTSTEPVIMEGSNSPLPTNSDATRDDLQWQKVNSPNHVKYPPLRFLSRNYDTDPYDQSLSPKRLSLGNTADDNSDLSVSSADTVIHVAHVSQDTASAMPSFVNDTGTLQNDDHETPRDQYEGDNWQYTIQEYTKETSSNRILHPTDIDNLMNADNSESWSDNISPSREIGQQYSDIIGDLSNQGLLSDKTKTNENRLAVSQNQTESGSNPVISIPSSGRETTRQILHNKEEGAATAGNLHTGEGLQGQSPTSDNKHHQVDKTTPTRQSSSVSTVNHGNSQTKETWDTPHTGEENTHRTPTHIGVQRSGTHPPPDGDKWTLNDDPQKDREVNSPNVIGDVTASQKEDYDYMAAVSGPLDNIHGKINNYRTKHTQGSSNDINYELYQDTVENKQFHNDQLQYIPHEDGTVIHTTESLHNGSLPAGTVNNHLGMNGMPLTQGERGHSKSEPSTNGQLMMDTAHLVRGSSPNQGIPHRDTSLSHPILTTIQNENYSDTSSVDSDGVPYRKSALKNRQSKDGVKRATRKVRFAEPLVMDETKPIVLSARERLGLNKNSNGGNLYKYIPSIGLKQTEDKLDISNSVDKSDNKRSQDSNSGLSRTQPMENKEPLMNGDIRGFQNPPPTNKQISTNMSVLSPGFEQYTQQEGSNLNPRLTQNNSSTSNRSNDDSGMHMVAQTVDTDNQSTDFVRKPENQVRRSKIIRRPGIHVTRLKNESQNISSTNPAKFNQSPLPSQPATSRVPPTPHQTASNNLRQERALSESQAQSDKSPRTTSQGTSLLRPKTADYSQRTTTTNDIRMGRYFPDPDRSSDNRSSWNMQNHQQQNRMSANDEPVHVKLGQKVLPSMDALNHRLSGSSSNDALSNPNLRRNADPNASLRELDSQNASSRRVTRPVSQYPPGIEPPDIYPKSDPLGRYGPATEDLAVLPLQSDTSSVPSPVSGDSGISSSSSLTDINKEQLPDNLGDNYSTLTYIRSNKTKNVMDRMDNMRRSNVRIHPGVQHQHSTPVDGAPTNVIRRDSGANQARRRIVSDVQSNRGSNIDQWASMNRFSKDDSQMGYDSRTTSMTSQADSAISYQGSDYHSQYGPHPQALAGGNPSINSNHGTYDYYRDDENPYGSFLKSETNRKPSSSKLVPIPLDILNPRAHTDNNQPHERQPQQYGGEHPSRHNHSVRSSISESNPSHYPNSPSYNQYSNYTEPRGYGRGSSPHPGLMNQSAHRQAQGGQSDSPQYSSTADIYNLLKSKTRNPFVRSGDFQ